MLARMVDDVARPEPPHAVRRAVEADNRRSRRSRRRGRTSTMPGDVEEPELPHPRRQREHRARREHARRRCCPVPSASEVSVSRGSVALRSLIRGDDHLRQHQQHEGREWPESTGSAQVIPPDLHHDVSCASSPSHILQEVRRTAARLEHPLAAARSSRLRAKGAPERRASMPHRNLARRGA